MKPEHVKGWISGIAALVVGVGAIVILRTSGKILHVEWMADLLWLLPIVILLWRFRKDWDAYKQEPSTFVRLAPALVLFLCMLLYLYSSVVWHKWFYFTRWLKFGDGYLDSEVARLAALTALLTPLLVFGARKMWMLVMTVLLVLQFMCFANFMIGTGGVPLYSDDHPSFMFRLWEFGETYPQLASFNPYWNGGTIHNVGSATGVHAIGLVIFPVWKFMVTHEVYTVAVALLYIVAMPLLAVLSLRIMGAGGTACWAAGILALGVSQHFFLWMLHYGTVASSFTFAFLPLVYACSYRIVWLNKCDIWTALLLIVAIYFLVQWPPGTIMVAPLALSMVLSFKQWSKKKVFILVACMAVFFAIWARQFSDIMAHNADTMSFVLHQEEFDEAAKEPVFTAVMAEQGWNHLLDHLREAHPVLIFFGLLGVLFVAQRGVTAWMIPVLLTLAFLGGWGRELLPNLQLSRMATPLLFAAIIPAAMITGRLLDTTDPKLCLVRAYLLALLFLGGGSIARIYANQTAAPYRILPVETQNLCDWIERETPEGSRFMFAGKTVHAYGRGHIAYMPRLAEREMMAADYYAFPPEQVEYDYPPKRYRKKPEKFLTFADAYNISHVVTYHDRYKRFYREHTDLFEEVPSEEIGTYDYLSVFKVNRDASMFVQGTGEVTAAFNKINVYVDDPEEDVVLKYNWLEGLQAPEPVEIHPYEVAEDITLIRIVPNGTPAFTIRY